MLGPDSPFGDPVRRTYGPVRHARDRPARGGLCRRGLLGLVFARPVPTTGSVTRSLAAPSPDLLRAPLELGGDWGASRPASARAVILRARQACLSGLHLRSDRQPRELRVDHRPGSRPHIWLPADRPETGWVVVSIGERDWCKLAYQFGHELGHVLCNSWAPPAKPRPPCQWVEEASVEAFSLRGLARLAGDWERDPPFPGDEAFAGAIRRYRAGAIASYARHSGDGSDLAAWFRGRADALGAATGLDALQGPAVLAILAELERDAGCVEDMGALNRWPSRSAVPLGEYLHLWSQSCEEVRAPGRLPRWLEGALRP